MIISKTPFRIPLSGGGTDIKFYYELRKGELLSLAINQYAYVFLTERKISKDFLIQTTKSQFTKKINHIDHDLIRETLKFFKISNYIQVGTHTSIPTNTGLGTSSSIMIGLVNCIYRYLNLKFDKEKIIKDAYKIEREICGLKGGWQDQIISAYGGVQLIKIDKRGKFRVNSIKLKKNKISQIENNLFLIFSNVKRDSSSVIQSQIKNKNKIIEKYDNLKKLNLEVINFLKNEKNNNLGSVFNKHWEIKRNLSKEISSSKLDKIYFKCKKIFDGGKLIGAGGGGFFLMYSKNPTRALKKLKKSKLGFYQFKIDHLGTRIINDNII